MGVYSYQKCLETQIGLGLDLKGGMNVILEISVPDVVEVLADHKTDPAFVKSMNEAKKEEETSQSDFISLFINAYKKNAPGHRLAEIFATQQLKGKVSTQSSDSEVEKALRAEVQSAIDNSFNVVRNRIDKFGVVQPNIQKLEGQDGRIMVEMPGIREPERIRKLLQGSANLEFWETYNSDEIIPYFSQLDQRFANDGAEATEAPADSVKAEQADTTKQAEAKKEAGKFTLNKDNKVADKDSNADLEAAKKQHPLLALIQPMSQNIGLVAMANIRDTADINKIIYSDLAKQVLPSDLRLVWGAKPSDMVGGNKERIANAPVLIVSTFEQGKSGFFQGEKTNEVGDGWGAYDNGLSNCYLILKARAMGFDTLIMGMRDADKLRELFAIPGNETIMAVIALGYRAEEPKRPERRDLNEIVKFF